MILHTGFRIAIELFVVINGKMLYSDFDLKKVKAEFKLKIIETEDLFSQYDTIFLIFNVIKIEKLNG